MLDAADLPLVEGWRWHLHTHGYAKSGSSGKQVFMHRLVLGLTDRTQHVDHIDGDRLNNRRENLRIVTQYENQQNRSALGRGTSKYRGVSWNTRLNRWLVQGVVNGKWYYGGLFEDEDEAGAAAAAWRAEHMPYSPEARA